MIRPISAGVVLLSLVAVPVGAAPAAPDVVSTGALDFSLAKAPGHFVLRDEAYEVTFAVEPKVTSQDQVAPSGVKIHTVLALGDTGNDGFGFMVLPIPTGVPYDVTGGLNAARDGFLTNVKGTLVSESPMTIGGHLKGRHIIGTAEVGGHRAILDLQLAWDEGHRSVVAVYVLTLATALSPANKAFEASFKVNPKGKAPPAGNGT